MIVIHSIGRILVSACLDRINFPTQCSGFLPRCNLCIPRLFTSILNVSEPMRFEAEQAPNPSQSVFCNLLVKFSVTKLRNSVEMCGMCGIGGILPPTRRIQQCEKERKKEREREGGLLIHKGRAGNSTNSTNSTDGDNEEFGILRFETELFQFVKNSEKCHR